MNHGTRSLLWDFNRELVVGEFGALGVANLTALVAARYTQSAAVISAAAIPGTLLGGSLFWLTARVYDQVTGQRFAAKRLASDIAWFTPAAIVLGLAVYDPAIFLISRRLLQQGGRVGVSVAIGQTLAFLLFLGAMNAYRSLLRKAAGKCL